MENLTDTLDKLRELEEKKDSTSDTLEGVTEQISEASCVLFDDSIEGVSALKIGLFPDNKLAFFSINGYSIRLKKETMEGLAKYTKVLSRLM